MAKKYDLTAMEIFEYLHQFDKKGFNDECKGFLEKDIEEVEKKYNIKFPNVYREYMIYCGYHPINNIHDHICEPHEILSTYDYLSEEIIEYSEDLEGLTQEGIDILCKEYEMYKLCQLPKEKWNLVTEEYIITWYENQGVWNAGYLRSDLEKGIENPPMYISTNDDFITFEKAADNTDKFFKFIFFSVLWSLKDYITVIDGKENVISAIKQNELDEKFDMCIDTEKNILYTYFIKDDFAQMIIANPKKA